MSKGYKKIEKRVSLLAQEVGIMFRQEGSSLRNYQMANNPKELFDDGRIDEKRLDSLMSGESFNRMV